MPGDVVKLAGEASPGAFAPHSLEPVVQCPGDRLRLGLSREPRQRLRQLLGSPVPDVQCHRFSLHVEQHLHCSNRHQIRVRTTRSKSRIGRDDYNRSPRAPTRPTWGAPTSSGRRRNVPPRPAARPGGGPPPPRPPPAGLPAPARSPGRAPAPPFPEETDEARNFQCRRRGRKPHHGAFRLPLPAPRRGGRPPVRQPGHHRAPHHARVERRAGHGLRAWPPGRYRGRDGGRLRPG